MQIFLAHAKEDITQVRELYNRLKDKGYKPWLDKEDLLPGQKWREEIPRAIKNSDFIIICLSSNSVDKKGYLQREFKLALNEAVEKAQGTIFLLPVRLDRCEVPDIQLVDLGENLRNYQWVNYYENDAFQKLVNAIELQRSKINPNSEESAQKDSSIKQKEGINKLVPSSIIKTSIVDVLIITALKDELDALKNCDNESGKTWEECKDQLNFSYYKKTLKNNQGQELTIAVASAVNMGENAVTELASRLITLLNPSYLAMTGVCAGNKNDVFLGDVIVADRVFKFDYGKLKAYYQEIEGQTFRQEEISRDITTYNLKPLWKQKIEYFSEDWINTIQTIRPKSYLHQESWVLNKLYEYQNNSKSTRTLKEDAERNEECSDWKNVIERLENKDFLKTQPFELTQKGIERVEKERLIEDAGFYQDPPSPKVKIGVIGTTSWVQKDPKIFEDLKKIQRKALGVEMESAAIGAVANIYEIPMIIVKSVQDYADYDKNDQFRFYAAETSARFLLAFLQEYFEPKKK